MKLVLEKRYEVIPFSVPYDRPYISGYGFLEYKSFFFRKLCQLGGV